MLLVEELRKGIPMRDGPLGPQPSRLDAEDLMRRAADRIEEVEAENRKLRANPFGAPGPEMISCDPAPHAAKPAVVTGKTYKL